MPLPAQSTTRITYLKERMKGIFDKEETGLGLIYFGGKYRIKIYRNNKLQDVQNRWAQIKFHCRTFLRVNHKATGTRLLKYKAGNEGLS